MTRIILRRNSHHNPAISIAFIARILTHSIRDKSPWFGGRRHHQSTGTHTETIDRTTILTMVNQFVIGGTQKLMAGAIAKTAAIDRTLGMFHPKTNGKRFSFDVNPARKQHFKSIAGAMSHRQNYIITSNIFSTGGGKSLHFSIFDMDIFHTSLKPNFTA